MSPELLGPWVPEGFDDFWRETEASVGVPDFEIGPEVSGRSTSHIVRTVSMSSTAGFVLNGWIAVPHGDGPFPAFLWTPPYSRWSMMPNEYGTRPGYVSLSFNLFGESSFHEETYSPARGYFAEGIESPETWVFRRLYRDSSLAIRALGQLPFVKSVAAMGMSQGGGISVWLGAWAPSVRCVVGDMPFLAGGRAILSAPFYRYPLKEILDYIDDNSERRERVLRTMSFYDTVNQATRCSVPALITAGTRDPSVRPAQAEAVYEALQGPKEYEKFDWGHDWHPSMVDRNLRWLDRWTA